jgi:hypothetical protein
VKPAVLVMIAAVAVAACSSSGHPATSATTTTRGATASTTATTLEPTPTTRLIPSTPGGAPGPMVTVPTESGTRPISEVIDSGQQILIEPASFYPRILIADVKVPITWTNLTTTAQALVFLNSSLRSPLIPPGGKWSYTAPTSLNLHYVDHALGTQATVDFNGAP